jgi:phosphoglycolate phosphatase-like HAD superfamily hydrolase
METERRLLLFDIDGTLITSGGAGEGALKDAMKGRFGVEEDLQGILLAGATDAKIARELLAKHGIEATAENVAALLDEYLQHLAGRMSRHDGRWLPGIVPVLEALEIRPEAVSIWKGLFSLIRSSSRLLSTLITLASSFGFASRFDIVDFSKRNTPAEERRCG